MAGRTRTKTREERETEARDQGQHGSNGEKCIEYTNVKLDELLAYEPDPQTALISNRYLEKGSSLVICGQAGIGKSRLATQFAICCVTGIPFLGWKTNAENLRVWILQNENSEGRQAEETQKMTVINLLRKVPLFANLKDEDKVCVEETEEWRLPAGEMLVEERKRAEYFFVLLEGEISVWKKHAGQDVVVARNRPGAFFGEVPLLLGRPYMMSGRAECDCRLIVFPEEAFWKLLRLCPAVSGEIFRRMSTRLRNIEGSARQQEKLEALGTMSAGLAHELNNPSAAAQRIAVHLGEVIQTIQSVAHRLHHALEHEHWDRLIALVGKVLENLSADKHYHSIEESDSEEALTAWLREGRVTDAWKIAPTLVGAGLDTSRLVSLRELLPKNAFGDALQWIALRLKIQTLLEDAEQCTGRIASLVEAVRSIARQERAELADIDVHEQIWSALDVLNHKLKNVRITQNFSSECGHVRGYPSELAQVWVNLLDNAADAVNGGGKIAIQTQRDDNQTVVEIIDNGPGISPENFSHIFEPFFTTKGVGSGKGLGLR